MISEARVETDRSGDYLRDVCQHVRETARHPRMQAHVELSDDGGVISLGGGRCTLRANPGVLTLIAEAPDEDGLRLIERRVGNLVKRLGKTDHLAVTWGPLRGPRDVDSLRYPNTGDDVGAGPESGSLAGTSRWGKVILIIAIALLSLVVIVIHLLGGGFRGLHG